MSSAGLDFLARWEGLRLVPYDDAAGNATVGVGHLLHPGSVTDADRRRWAGFTHAEALELLAHDVARADAAVGELVHPPFSLQYRQDAIVSFVFNVGTSAFAGSHFLALVNSGVRGVPAGDELLRWDHAGGRELAGLTRRRLAERALYLHGTYGTGP